MTIFWIGEFHYSCIKRVFKTSKKYKLGGKRRILELVEEAVHLLVFHDFESLTALRIVWRDHALKGEKAGIRELHVGQDDLLLYQVDEECGIITLIDIVSHEELRKQ